MFFLYLYKKDGKKYYYFSVVVGYMNNKFNSIKLLSNQSTPG
jgi:hypothetical protein